MSGNTTIDDQDETGRIPPDSTIAERRREAEEALRFCDERCRHLVQACIDYELPLPVVGYELQDDGGRVCADAELAWQQQRVAVLLPERPEGMEAFRSQGWNVFLAPDLPEGRLLELLSE